MQINYKGDARLFIIKMLKIESNVVQSDGSVVSISTSNCLGQQQQQGTDRISLDSQKIHSCPLNCVSAGDQQQPSVTPLSPRSRPQPTPPQSESPTPQISSTLFRPMNIPRHQVPTPLPESLVTTDACSLPRAIGPCKGARPRYYFNPLTKTCEPFTFGGCGGNRNNFVSLQDCSRVCGPSAQESSRMGSNSPLSRSSSTNDGTQSTTYERKTKNTSACATPWLDVLFCFNFP